MFRMTTCARYDVEDPDFQHVAGLGVLHRHGPRADVYAKAFAGAAPEYAGIHRTRAAAIHVLPRLGPAEYVFGGGIARDHQLRIVGGVLRQGFDGDGIARGDLELRL